MRRYDPDKTPALSDNERHRLRNQAETARRAAEIAKSRSDLMQLTPGRKWHKDVLLIVGRIHDEMLRARDFKVSPGWMDAVAEDIERFLFNTELRADEVLGDASLGGVVSRPFDALLWQLTRVRHIPSPALARALDRASNSILPRIKRHDEVEKASRGAAPAAA